MLKTLEKFSEWKDRVMKIFGMFDSKQKKCPVCGIDPWEMGSVMNKFKDEIVNECILVFLIESHRTKDSIHIVKALEKIKIK